METMKKACPCIRLRRLIPNAYPSDVGLDGGAKPRNKKIFYNENSRMHKRYISPLHVPNAFGTSEVSRQCNLQGLCATEQPRDQLISTSRNAAHIDPSLFRSSRTLWMISLKHPKCYHTASLERVLVRESCLFITDIVIYTLEFCYAMTPKTINTIV